MQEINADSSTGRKGHIFKSWLVIFITLLSVINRRTTQKVNKDLRDFNTNVTYVNVIDILYNTTTNNCGIHINFKGT